MMTQDSVAQKADECRMEHAGDACSVRMTKHRCAGAPHPVHSFAQWASHPINPLRGCRQVQPRRRGAFAGIHAHNPRGRRAKKL
eukprot:2144459-Alexandrium_andersonii.AAC.1